jgi:menaquinol-cytochrome c reductase iron-sulfur subunit
MRRKANQMSSEPEPTAEPETSERDRALSPERRTFVTRAGLAFGALATLVLGVPIIGFLLWPVRRDAPDAWRPVGSIDDFEVGATVLVTFVDPDPLPWAGFTAESAAYVRRETPDTFLAFSIYCTHTGCPVHWLEGAQLFYCPCHAGTFSRLGSVAAGPPPRPLERHEVRLRNGQVEIRTRRIPLGDGGVRRGERP